MSPTLASLAATAVLAAACDAAEGAPPTPSPDATTSSPADAGGGASLPRSDVEPRDEPDADPTAERGAGPDVQPDAETWADTGADMGADPCAEETLGALFDAKVRSHLVACPACHDMTVAPGLLKAPGPPWYHPTDGSEVVSTLMRRGLIDPTVPEESLFLLKPLDPADGGVIHTGGTWVEEGSPAWDGFLAFLVPASACAPARLEAPPAGR